MREHARESERERDIGVERKRAREMAADEFQGRNSLRTPRRVSIPVSPNVHLYTAICSRALDDFFSPSVNAPRSLLFSQELPRDIYRRAIMHYRLIVHHREVNEMRG